MYGGWCRRAWSRHEDIDRAVDWCGRAQEEASRRRPDHVPAHEWVRLAHQHAIDRSSHPGHRRLDHARCRLPLVAVSRMQRSASTAMVWVRRGDVRAAVKHGVPRPRLRHAACTASMLLDGFCTNSSASTESSSSTSSGIASSGVAMRCHAHRWDMQQPRSGRHRREGGHRLRVEDGVEMGSRSRSDPLRRRLAVAASIIIESGQSSCSSIWTRRSTRLVRLMNTVANGGVRCVAVVHRAVVQPGRR